MPLFLKQNPLPEWIDIWQNQGHQAFWRRYFLDKEAGKLPPKFSHDSLKKSHKKPKYGGKKRKRRKSSDGSDAKPDKKSKKKN